MWEWAWPWGGRWPISSRRLPATPDPRGPHPPTYILISWSLPTAAPTPSATLRRLIHSPLPLSSLSLSLSLFSSGSSVSLTTTTTAREREREGRVPDQRVQGNFESKRRLVFPRPRFADGGGKGGSRFRRRRNRDCSQRRNDFGPGTVVSRFRERGCLIARCTMEVTES